MTTRVQFSKKIEISFSGAVALSKKFEWHKSRQDLSEASGSNIGEFFSLLNFLV